MVEVVMTQPRSQGLALGGKMRDPGNEVGNDLVISLEGILLLVKFVMQLLFLCYQIIQYSCKTLTAKDTSIEFPALL